MTVCYQFHNKSKQESLLIMAIVIPFKAVRPQQKYVSQVAALPYDVMTRKEGQKIVAGNALSFLHVENRR